MFIVEILTKTSFVKLVVSPTKFWNLRQELQYGSHWSVRMYKREVTMSEAIVFKVKDAERIQGLLILPFEVVEEKGKLGVIHDFTFDGPRRGEDGEPNRSVNIDID